MALDLVLISQNLSSPMHDIGPWFGAIYSAQSAGYHRLAPRSTNHTAQAFGHVNWTTSYTIAPGQPCSLPVNDLSKKLAAWQASRPLLTTEQRSSGIVSSLSALPFSQLPSNSISMHQSHDRDSSHSNPHHLEKFTSGEQQKDTHRPSSPHQGHSKPLKKTHACGIQLTPMPTSHGWLNRP